MTEITLYGVFDALSIGSKPYDSDDTPKDKPRHITCMEQVGDDSEPYGGMKQREYLTGVERLTLPDGSEPDHGDTPTFGYDDNKAWAIYIEDESAGHYRIAEWTANE